MAEEAAAVSVRKPSDWIAPSAAVDALEKTVTSGVGGGKPGTMQTSCLDVDAGGSTGWKVAEVEVLRKNLGTTGFRRPLEMMTAWMRSCRVGLRMTSVLAADEQMHDPCTVADGTWLHRSRV